MDGILNINKPPGPTSFRIITLVRKLTGERRVGHAGTLDPAAEGVLPVFFGRATRFIQYLANARKTYRAEIELGIATDTYDAAGTVVARHDPSHITREQVESALAAFRGSIRQVPPMYSAVKQQGKPLYVLARAGIETERASRPADIYRFDILQWQNPVLVAEVECGKGTYIRSLAHDLGEALGCGAHLRALTRSKYGMFDIAEAVTPRELESAAAAGYWEYFTRPVDSILLDRAAMLLGEERCRMVCHGRPFQIDSAHTAENCRVYSVDGCFLGLLRLDSSTGFWRPEKVLR